MPSWLNFFGPQTGQEDPFGSELWPFWSWDLPSGFAAQHAENMASIYRACVYINLFSCSCQRIRSCSKAKPGPLLMWHTNVAWNPPKTHVLLTNAFLQSLPAGRKGFWSCRTSMALSQMDPGKPSGVVWCCAQCVWPHLRRRGRYSFQRMWNRFL